MPAAYYTVQVNNRFSELDDETETDGLLIVEAPTAVAAEKSAPKAPVAPKKNQQGGKGGSGWDAAAAPKKNEGRPNESRPPRRGGMGGPRGGRDDNGEEGRSPTSYRRPGVPGGGRGGHRFGERGGRGGGAGGGGGDHDRHSGTGRGKEVKKGGAGGHNWGEAEPEAPKVVAEWDAPAKEDEGTSKDGSPTAQEKEAGGEAPERTTPVEEEQLDVDAFKKLLLQKQANLPKAPQGQNRSVSEKELEMDGYALYAPEDGKGEVEGGAGKPKGKTEAKTPKNMNIYAYAEQAGVRMFDTRRRRGGGGERGGRGGDRKEREQTAEASAGSQRCSGAPLHNIVLTEDEFPTLGLA